MEMINIKFQEGPIKEVGKNGCQIEDVIQVLVDRIQTFQKGELRCRSNACAITHMEEAIMWLEYRTKKRSQQDVEGTRNAHNE